MTAYNTIDLDNRIIQQQASEAFRASCIGEESFAKILKAHPDKLYTPNYFIRLALGALTLVAVLFTTFLAVLFFGIHNNSALVMLVLFLAIVCYGILELMIKSKKYYNAGVDNILMFSCVVLIISTFFIYGDITNNTLISLITTILCLWLCLRFTDAFMASASYLAFFVFIFLLYLKLGAIAKAIAPILMMIVSAIVYFILKKTEQKKQSIFYLFSIDSVKFLTLVTFYAAANYFVVKELSNGMFGLHLSVNDGIPLGWLFWILTIIIPPAYIFYGIVKKDFLFIRTGLGLVAATVLTIRYYHALLPAEFFMLIGGALLMSLSYYLIQYLRTPRHGYTFQALHPANKSLLNIEALIIAQTLGKNTKAENNTLYAGGSGAGGGATGDF